MRLREVVSSVVAVLVVSACGAGKSAPSEPDFGSESSALPKGGQQRSIGPGEHHVVLFDASTTYFVFTLHGTAGETPSVYADGDQGLDTVLYLYRVSRTSGRPYGHAIATNDDTQASGWTGNAYSSSIDSFALPETRDYAIVATTYDRGTTGRATVWYDDALPTFDTPPPFGGTGAAKPLAFQGVGASALPLGQDIGDYDHALGGTAMVVLSRVQIASGDAQAILADATRLGTFAFDVIYYANSNPPGPTANYHGPATISSIAAADAAATLVQASAQGDPHLAEGEKLLVASMLGDGDFATSAVTVFKTHWDNEDDTSSDGVLAVDPATGEVRAVTYVNPP